MEEDDQNTVKTLVEQLRNKIAEQLSLIEEIEELIESNNNSYGTR